VRAHNLSMGEKLVVLDYGRERLYTEGREESQGASRAAEEITCVGYHHRQIFKDLDISLDSFLASPKVFAIVKGVTIVAKVMMAWKRMIDRD
jgi:hypothetical protein